MSSDTANLSNFVPPAFPNAKAPSPMSKAPGRQAAGKLKATAAFAGRSLATAVTQRAESIFTEELHTVRRDADRGFMYLMAIQWVFGVVVALFISPLTWSGGMSAVHIHLISAIVLGGLIVSLPIFLAWKYPGSTMTRQTMAVAQMLYGALLIHLTGGRIETHFHIFGSLAFLSFYRDWRVLLTGSLVVVLDHAVRGLFWPMSIFGIDGSGAPGSLDILLLARVAEHGGWVLFESVFLSMAVNQSLKEMRGAALTTAEHDALSDNELRRAHQQADTILSSVDEGLFLMDAEYRIGAKYSSALPTMLGLEDPAGYTLLDILRGGVSERNYLNAVQFLKLMFDARKKEKQIQRVNPLESVEINVQHTTGVFKTRNLDFRFSRVMEGDKVGQLLVTVSDVTERVKLEQQLEESERTKDRQLSMLLNILHVEPALLREFIGSAENTLHQVNDTLKEARDPSQNSDAQRQAQFRSKLEIIGRLLHQFKGNAALLALEFFVQRTHEMEDNLAELRQRTSLSGTDFLQLVLKQSDMEQALVETRDLLERMAGMRHALPLEAVAAASSAIAATPPIPGQPAATPSAPAVEEPVVANLTDALGEYISRTSARIGKPAELDAREFRETAVPTKYRAVLRDVLTHFANNALVHGLEPSPIRDTKGKPPTGRLILRTLENDPATFQFSFSDDGHGLQASKLRGRAIEMGLATPEEVSAWPGHKLVELIFEPGFSTSDGASTEAGRGFGMNVVKDRVVKEFGGEIRVSSVPGSGCSFHIVLPA